MNLSKAFQIVDVSSKRKSNNKNDINRTGNLNGNGQTKDKDNSLEISLCLWEPHRKAGINTEWSGIPRDTKTSFSVGRILMASSRKVKNDEIAKKENEKEDKTNTSSKTQPHPRSNYDINKANIDPFPNPSLI